MHRFFPALATREGALVLQHDVNHRPRSKGSSNYTNLGRLFVSIFDIVGMIWLLKRYPKNYINLEKFICRVEVSCWSRTTAQIFL